MIETETEVSQIDESISKPVQITTLEQTDHLNYFYAEFEDTLDPNEPKSIGRIKLEWEAQNNTIVSQFNAIWLSCAESLSQRRCYDSSTKSCYVPVTRTKSFTN